MGKPHHPATRRSLRRSLLGIALVLHVAWLALGPAPAAATTLPQAGADTVLAESAVMPCHEAAPHHEAPAPLKPAPSHVPCCAQHCGYASGLCSNTTLLVHDAPAQVLYQRLSREITLLPTRAPIPELRPPILH